LHKKSLRGVSPNHDDNQDMGGKECLGGQTRHDCTTGVNQLLVSGDHDTDSWQTFVIRMYAKASGLYSELPERERCRAWTRTVRLNIKSISYIRTV